MSPPGDWGRITALEGSTLALSQAWIAYAGQGGSPAINGETTGAFTWSGGGAVSNSAGGLNLIGTTFALANLKVSENSSWGLVLRPSVSAIVSNSDIANNIDGGMKNDDITPTVAVDARNSWCAEAPPPGIGPVWSTRRTQRIVHLR